MIFKTKHNILNISILYNFCAHVKYILKVGETIINYNIFFNKIWLLQVADHTFEDLQQAKVTYQLIIQIV